MKHNRNITILIILAAAILTVSAAAYLYRRGQPSAPSRSREVRIYQNGVLVQTAHLGQAEDAVIRGENGEVNVIGFHGDGVYMKQSTCRNQLCVQQGEVTMTNFSGRFYGNRIICLPNRVTVELVLEEGERPEGMPDV